MQKVLFLDRDGTLIIEPPDDYQVDSLEKLEFYPGVFRNLYRISKDIDFRLVVVSNQDGLGSPDYPEEVFKKIQDKFLRAFANEGVVFDEILIDRSLPGDHVPTRKPGTGLLTGYLKGDYDLLGSYVIGDRITDLKLARNLGTRGILLGDKPEAGIIEKEGLGEVCRLIAPGWDRIYEFLRAEQRRVHITRETAETRVQIDLALDGQGKSEISTGLGFFDHMLHQIPGHSGCDLVITAKGDLEVDEHHTIEDTGLALGEACRKALGDKSGISRYGFTLPMDDSLATVVMDFSDRSWLTWKAVFRREKIGDMPTETFSHFFRSFADAAGCNLHIHVEGENEHHKIESVFKAFARALGQAVKRAPGPGGVPSTKGKL